MNRLNVFKTHPDVVLPKFATKGSACFDLAFQSAGKVAYKGYNQYNAPIERVLANGKIILMPKDRILVPTGIIFDIPTGYSVRIHARSGLSLKQGLVLANAEAVIDSDYVEETMVMLINSSEASITINTGDRIAQAEMVKSEEYVLWETYDRPYQKTDRAGGLGSTGLGTVQITTTGVVQTEDFIFPKRSESVGKGTELLELPKGARLVLEEEKEEVKRGRGRPRKNPI
jgi:dUTP pyrophosphatase